MTPKPYTHHHGRILRATRPVHECSECGSPLTAEEEQAGRRNGSGHLVCRRCGGEATVLQKEGMA